VATLDETRREVDRRHEELPSEFATANLRKRALIVIAILVALGLVALLAPGLGKLRAELDDANWRWLAAGVVLEFLSGMSYVLMFRPIFCRLMTRRSAFELGWSELAMGSIVPASGAGGLALGAWVLSRDGMNPERIARRSVAFFLIKSSVNFVAVAILGVIMFAGLGPHQSWALTILPAGVAVALIGAVGFVPRIGDGPDPPAGAGRVRRGLSSARRALVEGVAGALEVIRNRDPAVLVGSVGYWAFDNAVLWATFHAFGASPAITVVLMAYLIGQIGGILPLPGGIGGIDGGLLGTFIVYGTPAAVTGAAVLGYRFILFWLPLLVGGAAFTSLSRGLNEPGRPDLCRDPN
jgi:uncharacterized membrane protein YbhN (UPF0104 family)